MSLISLCCNDLIETDMGCWAVIDRLIDRVWQVQCRTVIESEIEREQGCIALWKHGLEVL